MYIQFVQHPFPQFSMVIVGWNGLGKNILSAEKNGHYGVHPIAKQTQKSYDIDR